MPCILLKTTIPPTPDDWHIGRFGLLAVHLDSLGHTVTARDLDQRDGADTDLAAAADGAHDQLWLFGVDGTGALGPADIDAIDRFRARGGGVLLSRDHQDLGACLGLIPGIGLTQHFQSRNPESDPERQAADDIGTPRLGWPNYHSGKNGDVQAISTLDPLHSLVTRADGSPIRWFPAHPHEGTVSAPDALPGARVVACGQSAQTGRRFNLVVAVEEPGKGRAVADSSFHHFTDCNWDPRAGAPSFVDEPWGDAVLTTPGARADAERYAANIAAWLS